MNKFLILITGFFLLSAQAAERPLTIYSATSKLTHVAQNIDKTVQAIANAVAPRQIQYQNVSIPKLLDIAKSNQADIIIAGAAFTSRRNMLGYRDIGSAVTRNQKSINHANGSTVIALKTRDDLKELQDLKGKAIIANDPEGFQGFIILLYSIKKLGFDPDNFFGKVNFVGNELPSQLNALRQGDADALVMPSCHFEMIKESGNDVSDLKIVGKKAQTYIDCAVSTILFPNWSLMVSPDLDFETQHDILKGINSLNKEKDGIAWGFAADDSPVREMYKELKRGPYEYLQHWSVIRIWEEYKSLLIFTFALAIGFCFHYLRIRKLVNQRTQQLVSSMEKQRLLTKRNLKLQKDFERAQNSIAVSHFSSLVAHELSQPLSGIIMYATSIKNLLKKESNKTEEQISALNATEKLLQRAMKSAEIIEEVRSFAKSKKRAKEPVDLVSLIKESVEEFKETYPKWNGKISFNSPLKEAICYGAIFDIKLVFFNLFRNSVNATSSVSSPRIKVNCIRTHGQWIEITVEDNGPEIDSSLIKQLGAPIDSFKKQGLGLGLSIIKFIIENHQGHLTFTHSPDGGLSVIIQFRLLEI